MLLGLSAAAIVLIVLLWVLYLPELRSQITALRSRPRERPDGEVDYDPGRERRAELRARALLRSCVGAEDWAMYRDLGFLRVWGKAGGQRSSPVPHAYLIYPHRPIVAYLPQTGVLLNEYCVAFPDHTRPYGSSRLPDSDDVLAKWMALSADEKGLISQANMHLPGRQLDPDAIRRDLQRLSRWEREQLVAQQRRDGSVHAP
ncbi:MAG TPA: hypothetical protein VID48_07770 [Solirubrobacteraceae bacterium]|jgi:hypothetical protein